MGFTHKRRNYVRPVSSLPVLETRYSTVSEEDEHGAIHERIVGKVVNVTDPENIENLPDEDDYKLANLLAAGVPIDFVPTNILNPSDPADIEDTAVDLALRATKEEIVTPFEPSSPVPSTDTPPVEDEN